MKRERSLPEQRYYSQLILRDERIEMAIAQMQAFKVLLEASEGEVG